MEGCDSTIELLPLWFYYQSNPKATRTLSVKVAHNAAARALADFMERARAVLLEGNTFGICLSYVDAGQQALSAGTLSRKFLGDSN